MKESGESKGHLGKHVQNVILNGKMRRNSQEELHGVSLGRSERVVVQMVLGHLSPLP